MRRLGIFSIQSSGRHIQYLLNDIIGCLQDLIIISSGDIIIDERADLSKYTKNIFKIDRPGFEIGAWQQGILGFLEQKFDKYDEVVLFNDAFYGPIQNNFSRIFDEMESKNCDFWGLTMQHESKDQHGITPSGYLPAHLQMSFVTIRKKMLCSSEFWSYWKNVKYESEPNYPMGHHELFFTEFFSNLGFTWLSYVPMDDMDYCKDKNYNLALYNQYELISKKRCPVFYKKPFEFTKSIQLSYGNADDLTRTLSYINDKLNYEIDMIYEDIIHTLNHADIYSSLHLNYILPSKGVLTQRKSGKRKIAVIMHMFYPDIFSYSCSYAESLPDDADLIVTTNNDEKCGIIKEMLAPILGDRLTVLNCGNRGRDVAALLVASHPYLMNYEYLCFVHDKKSSHLIPVTGASYQDVLWDNVLKSKYFVEQVIDLFDREPRLGVLSPPSPYAGSWFGIMANTWTSCFDVTMKLYDKLKLTVNITPDKRVIALGTVFWCRPKALQQLFAYPWKYSDFPPEPMGLDATLGHAVERIISFVAQENGYYTGWLLNDEYAGLEINNYQGMMDEVVKNAILHYGINYCEGFTTFINCMNGRLEYADKQMQYKMVPRIKKIAIKILPSKIVYRIHRFLEYYRSKHVR